MLAVIILMLIISCNNCFTVHKIIIFLESFHFWCVMHLISFQIKFRNYIAQNNYFFGEFPLFGEFLDLQIKFRNYIAILVIPRIRKSLLNHLYSILVCFQLCFY
jgi:hypothetical protein